MKKELFTVHLNHLSNPDTASLFVQTGEHAIPVKSYLGEMANAALNDFTTQGSRFQCASQQSEKKQIHRASNGGSENKYRPDCRN